MCQISTDKQREGLTIQSEGGVKGKPVSVVDGGGGNSCGQDGIVVERVRRTLAGVWQALHFSHLLLRAARILDTLLQQPA